MSDLISRQAVIEDLRMTDINKIWDIADVELWVNGLPSAQPEITACDDCKYADDKPISDGRRWCNLHGFFMYYCSDAERREGGKN